MNPARHEQLSLIGEAPVYWDLPTESDPSERRITEQETELLYAAEWLDMTSRLGPHAYVPQDDPDARLGGYDNPYP